MNRKERRASEANGRSMMKNGWNPFEEITAEARLLPSFQEMISKPEKVFKNNLYIVQVWAPVETSWGTLTKVGLRRNDASKVHSWADIFRIKNEIFGPQRAAFEAYPPQSQLVDVANMYWLWVLGDGCVLPVSI